MEAELSDFKIASSCQKRISRKVFSRENRFYLVLQQSEGKTKQENRAFVKKQIPHAQENVHGKNRRERRNEPMQSN